jgi:hypothetical protein
VRAVEGVSFTVLARRDARVRRRERQRQVDDRALHLRLIEPTRGAVRSTARMAGARRARPAADAPADAGIFQDRCSSLRSRA